MARYSMGRQYVIQKDAMTQIADGGLESQRRAAELLRQAKATASDAALARTETEVERARLTAASEIRAQELQALQIALDTEGAVRCDARSALDRG